MSDTTLRKTDLIIKFRKRELPVPLTQPDPDITALVLELAEKINQYARGPYANLLYGLKRVVYNYAWLPEIVRDAVNQLIVTELEDMGLALLTVSEVSQWWDTLPEAPLPNFCGRPLPPGWWR